MKSKIGERQSGEGGGGEGVGGESLAYLYEGIKSKYTAIEYAKQAFSDQAYQSELKANIIPKPPYALQAYKGKLSAFTADIKRKYAKNMAVNANKKTLCLGLQHVLMMISTFGTERADAIIPIYPDGCESAIGELTVAYRPYLKDFLDDMKSKYELILYSSFSNTYIKPIIGILEREEKYFDYRFDETFCIFANISYGVKCIDFLLHNRSPADIIVIDTNVNTLPLSVNNFIPILYYQGNEKDDTELVKLAVLLDELAKVKDVREGIKKFRGNYDD